MTTESSPARSRNLSGLHNDYNDIKKSGILGPVFRCILADTFKRLKFGDRFFYDNYGTEATRFMELQLKEIRKSSMARILCDNTGPMVSEMQPEAFMQSDQADNQLVSCLDTNVIPMVDLNAF